MTGLQSTPITKSGDFYVPRFEVIIDGKPLTNTVRDIVQVSYKDSIEDIDSFELTVNNWDDAQRKFKYHDRDLFNPGHAVELKMGYLGSGGAGMRTMIRGTITGLKPSFPAGGQPTLAVSGLNVLHTLRKEQKSDKYEKEKITDIAKKICTRLQIGFVDSGVPVVETPHPHLIQDNQYDILFLLALAREAGYELVVTEDKGKTAIMFGPPSPAAKVAYRLSYGRTLTEFQPTLSVANQVSDVEVRGWDPVKGEAILVKVGQEQLDKKGIQGKLKKGTKNPVNDRKEVIGNRPVRDAQAARELARGVLTRINSEVVKASGSVVGLPELRSGSSLHIDGLGLRFNGRYFVTSTTHAIGSGGYTTQFECRLEELTHQSDGESIT